jgi:molybdopterin guanine dinucleotide-containing S/N-oxide reductase-like protein
MAEEILTQCTDGGAVHVHVKDGKIIRIRPIVFDETDAPSWTIEARGKKFTPPRHTTLAWHHAAERNRIYSEQRIKYPMKRADFDPNSKNRHTENRGKSGYERISWDEALDIVTNEIKRIRKTYGPAAITACTSSHHNWGNLYYKTGPLPRFFRTLGYTELWDNPDSWEGRHWGAVHAYGYYQNLGNPKPASLEDVLQNTEMIVVWSNDPYSTVTYMGQDGMMRHLWIKQMGIKRVFIDPFGSYGACMLGDKWIAPRPATDGALAEAIAYVWLKEGTYDKYFVKNRTVGFEEFKKQTLGKLDGTPRTPGWAAEITTVPAHDIVALAREWAAKRTMMHFGGSGHRHGYCTESARLQVFLQAMQGWGKPGVNFFGMGVPSNPNFFHPGYNDGNWDMFSIVADKRSENKVTQKIYRLLLPDVILDPPVHWLGDGFCWQSLEQQFKPHTCPEPGPNGAPIKMVYRIGSSFISTMTDTNSWVRMYQSPNLEFAVNQDCWWGSETSHSDIILPACTNYEHSDISELGATGGYGRCQVGGGGNHRMIIYQKKCIEPLWESKSDYDIFCALAKRLGIWEAYTEGNSEEDWIKKVFNAYSISNYVTYKEFKKKGYFVVPLPEKKPSASKAPPKPRIASSWFYEGRDYDEGGPPPDPREGCIGTLSGKVEFVSQGLLKYFPKDRERRPLPTYIPTWEGHETTRLVKKYPLQLITPHVKFSYHTHTDNVAAWLDEIPPHRVIKNGYAWWPIRIHRLDAEPRGIKHGDIIKMYNDRGAVLGIAQITERVKPGTIHSYQASRKYEPIEPGKPGSPDKGGCTNLLSPHRLVSKNAPGQANMSCLAEISKWEV